MDYIKTKLECPVTVDGIYTVHYFEYAKDFAYSGEMHDFWELVYADKKNLFITAGAQEIELQAGQMYLHKPNEFHNIRCDGKRAANAVIVSAIAFSMLHFSFESFPVYLFTGIVFGLVTAISRSVYSWA